MSRPDPFKELLETGDTHLAANAFHSLAETIPQLVWSSNARGRCDYVNHRWSEFSGFPNQEFIGQNWKKLIHPDDLDTVNSRWATATEECDNYEVECRMRSGSGEYRRFFVRAVPLLKGSKVVRWFGTATALADPPRDDVRMPPDDESTALNDRNEDLEEQVAIRTRQLRETIAQLEAFAHSLAHDMRAPCRALTNYSQILLRDYADQLPEEPRGFLHRISSAADRLDSFVRDLLVYSRVAHDKMPLEHVDVEEILKDVIQSSPEFQPEAIDLEIQSPLLPVWANETLLAQCFTNLLSNACKFTRKGKKPKMAIWSEKRDETVLIYFEDNGIGISKADQERIFNVFERLNHERKFPGTGVGLSIVRKAVERMGGKVGVVSEPEKGSRFWIELRATEAIVEERDRF